nr:hypothetical protein Iba_chr09bCG14890 [Ipomoea batatas]GMD36418.1 hypothetical protein Iba_chr09dCG16240 [Ipomoea batatas]GME03453.1 hypothetical protein Iba_scaffold781CG0030 [Ipomoea batatas]
MQHHYMANYISLGYLAANAQELLLFHLSRDRHHQKKKIRPSLLQNANAMWCTNQHHRRLSLQASPLHP